MWGTVVPVRRGQWHYLPELAQAAEAAGWEYIFSDEGPGAKGNDSVAAAFVSAAATRRIRLGTSIAIIYYRHPYLLASTCKILQEVTGDRFILGLGVSHPDLNQPLGISMKSPAKEMRQYVSDVRRHLGEEAQTPIWLATTRLVMARLAGEIADGVNIFGVPHNLLARTIATVREGERQAGRAKRTLIATYARVGLSDDLEVARRAGRDDLRFYCSLPAYQQLYTDAGYADEVASFRRALERHDETAAYQALSDRLLDDTLVLGPERRCREGLERLRAAGVDVLLLAPLAVEGEDLPSLFRPLLQKLRAGRSER